jgi:hypothetical protein
MNNIFNISPTFIGDSETVYTAQFLPNPVRLSQVLALAIYTSTPPSRLEEEEKEDDDEDEEEKEDEYCCDTFYNTDVGV